MELYDIKVSLNNSLKKLKDLGDSLWPRWIKQQNKRIRRASNKRRFLEWPKKSSKCY